jgi:hypothetical protein
MRKSVLALALLASMAVSATLALLPERAEAGQYWETSTSGTGTTTGTGEYVYTWNSWSVPESPTNPCSGSSPYCFGGSDGYTAESVWLIHDGSHSIEAGFGSGYAVGTNGGWTSAMQPYYTYATSLTTNVEINATSAYNLPALTVIWMAESSNGSASGVQVNNWTPAVSYTVAANRTNFDQYETLYGDDWMGGGSPQTGKHMYYQPASSYPNGWSNWGTMTCADIDLSNTHEADDYTKTCNLSGQPYQWAAGGYGNGVDGS